MKQMNNFIIKFILDKRYLLGKCTKNIKVSQLKFIDFPNTFNSNLLYL